MPVETLTTEITRLGSAVDYWKAVRLVVVIGTALLALATILAQWMELRRSRELAAVQKELIAAKDDQLRKELAEKDIRIADANTAAARANAAAGQANERAGNANERAAGLERDSQSLKLELSAQRERTANAEKHAAEAKHDFVELAKVTGPRHMGTTYVLDEERALFAGTNVFITYAGGGESEGFAKELANVLASSQWNVLGIEAATPEFLRPAPPHVSEGVMMLTTSKGSSESPFDSPAIRAAAVLSEHLNEIGIQSRIETPTTGEAWPERIPADALLVKVGPKSERFWMDRLGETLIRSLPPEMQSQIAESEATKRWIEQGTRESREREKEKYRKIVQEQRLMKQKKQ